VAVDACRAEARSGQAGSFIPNRSRSHRLRQVFCERGRLRLRAQTGKARSRKPNRIWLLP
jgi:hypothetical protein